MRTGGTLQNAATVTLAEDAPDWAKGHLTVSDDGNIVLDIPPKGTVVIIQ